MLAASYKFRSPEVRVEPQGAAKQRGQGVAALARAWNNERLRYGDFVDHAMLPDAANVDGVASVDPSQPQQFNPSQVLVLLKFGSSHVLERRSIAAFRSPTGASMAADWKEVCRR